MDTGSATRTLTITLPEEQAERLDDAVRSGRFSSGSAMVSDALAIWERREAMRRDETARLKQAYEEGKASGEPEDFDPEAFLLEMNAEFSRRGR
jgi:antitoxin ParD1/3/4